jgi:predicted transcriptional regulator of viral defense system
MRERILGYRETQVFKLVLADLAERGVVRSYDAIAAALGMRHKSHVCDVIGRLERRGLIQRTGSGSRRTISARDGPEHSVTLAPSRGEQAEFWAIHQLEREARA